MNRRYIIILYCVIILLMLVAYFYIQRRYGYEHTHPQAVPARTSVVPR